MRIGAFGGQMALAPSMGAFATYPFNAYPGSPLWGPSGNAFGDLMVGDTMVGGLGDAYDFGAAMMSDQKFAAWLRTAKPAALKKHLAQLQKATRSGKGKKGKRANLQKVHARIQAIRQALQSKGGQRGQRGRGRKGRTSRTMHPKGQQRRMGMRRRFQHQMPRMSQQMPMRPQMQPMMPMPNSQIPDMMVPDYTAESAEAYQYPIPEPTVDMQNLTPDPNADPSMLDDLEEALDGFAGGIFGTVGDLVVGSVGGFGDLMVGTADSAADFAGLGGVFEPITSWWDGLSANGKLLAVGAVALAAYSSMGTSRVKFFSHGRSYAYATNPRRRRRSRRSRR